jgi:hypothetical protein
MALNPAAPIDNLRLDAETNCWYSIDPGDYVTLCSRCHFRMDNRIRASCAKFERARRNALRCSICGEPMMAGQRGAHLSCATAQAS